MGVGLIGILSTGGDLLPFKVAFLATQEPNN